MPTLADVRARLRRVLEDTDPVAPLWGDAELNDDLAQMVREYAARWPHEATVTIAPVAGQTDYPLPDGLRRVVLVECPPGQPVPRRPAKAGHEPGAAQTWAVFGGLLRLGLPPAGDISVWYLGAYPFPATDADDFGVPDDGVDLVVYGAALLALSRREVAAAKRRGANSVTLALEALRRHYVAALQARRQARGGVLG